MATTPLPPRSATTDKSVTSIPESQWTDRQRQYAAQYGLHGLGYQPLPTRNAVTDKSVTSIPEVQWTDRQRQYAQQYGLHGLSNPNGIPNAGTTGTPTTPVPAAGATSGDYDPSAAATAALKEAQNRDASANIQSVLDQYGLGSLAGWAWQEIVGGKSQAEVLQDMRQRPEFQTRFPGIAQREKAGLAPMSPAEYVAYEKQARQLMQANGLPQGFYDSNDDFTKFITGDVSLTELNDRVQLGKQAMYQSPVEVRAALKRDYGIDEGALTAYFLDPTRAEPLLQKQFTSSQIGGAAQRSGWGLTSQQENERLADLGVSADQAQQGFGQLAASSELFNPLDAGEAAISRNQQLGATFEGNGLAQRDISNRVARRKAAFDGGGSFAGNSSGVTGLGSLTS